MNYKDSKKYKKSINNKINKINNFDIVVEIMKKLYKHCFNSEWTKDIKNGISLASNEFNIRLQKVYNLFGVPLEEGRNGIYAPYNKLITPHIMTVVFGYFALKDVINVDEKYFEAPIITYDHFNNFDIDLYCKIINYLFENEFDLDLCISYTLERVELELTNKNNSNAKMSTIVDYPNYHIHKRSEMSPEEIFMYMNKEGGS